MLYFDHKEKLSSKKLDKGSLDHLHPVETQKRM